MNSPPAPRRLHRWLLVLPFVWQVGLAPWSNGVDLRPFHLPFPMAWQMAGILFTTLVIALVFLLDRRADAAEGRGVETTDADAAPPTSG
jgi:membrane protein implicated in regulation of membrane protease activity